MSIKSLVDNYMSFWNQADIDGIMSMYDESMLYHDMPSGEVIAYGDLKNHLSNTFGIGPNQELELELLDAIYLDEKSAFIYWKQSLPPAGSKNVTHFKGVELIVFTRDKITSIHEYYDYLQQGSDAQTTTSKDTGSDQMTKLGLTDSLTKDIADSITHYFDNQSPYLDPELNLTKVSDRLGFTRNQVSYVINNVLDQTFYDLVNVRRINHVIDQMSSGPTHPSILEMAINAGFNSISGFYNAFKKQTGMSPVKFQKSRLSGRKPT